MSNTNRLENANPLENPKPSISRWQSLSNVLPPISLLPSPKNPISARKKRKHPDSSPIFPAELRPSTTRSNFQKFFQDPIKCSIKENGIVKGYAACTNQGLVRNYNEDRVSIILNIAQPPRANAEVWPKSSFFGVFDGHGGSTCADFLRDNLHQYIVKTRFFPFAPKEAILEGFENAEKDFVQRAQNSRPVDKSGSCAIVVLIVADICYVANLGDSRAVMSSEAGFKIYPLSKDHKPFEEEELKRIVANGGKIYQSLGQVNSNPVLGPYRVLPGRLSVSRSFGDIEAKLTVYGGNDKVLISVPEVKAFKIHSEYEFIVLGSDGIFDKLTNKEVIQCAWAGIVEHNKANTHQMCGASVENIMRMALARRSLDNITVLVIAFEGMVSKVNQIRKYQDSEAREQDRFLPIANISRIMKKALPPNAKISKDAKECVQECVSEFISFITSEACEKCLSERRKTINGDDLLHAMTTLGFEKYIDPLRIYLQRYRDATKLDKPEDNGTTHALGLNTAPTKGSVKSDDEGEDSEKFT